MLPEMQRLYSTNMKIISLLYFIIATQTGLAQFKLTELNKTSIAKSIQYTGNLVQGVRWTDSTGDNIVILTLTETTRNARDEGRDRSLFGYHYIVSGDSLKQTWKVYDYVKDCPVDLFLYFIEESFAVTDLDKNGKAEVWIMYKVSCQGDVSPVTMKIIMYQDNKKFAVRGTSSTQVSENDWIGGEFVFDEAFKAAPVEFRKYAEKLWNQHKLETWQQ